MWSAVFYFNQPIGNIAGIQVGVWGDTKEVAYCRPQRYLGNSRLPQNSSYPLQLNSDNLLILAVITLTALIAVAVAIVFIKKKRK
jgi:hypothetical protein